MKLKQRIANLVYSEAFNRVVAVVIVACAAWVGVETLFLESDWKILFLVIDLVFTGFFILEISLRIWADKDALSFFYILKPDREAIAQKEYRFNLTFSERGFWNWFDFIIITLFTLRQLGDVASLLSL